MDAVERADWLPTPERADLVGARDRPRGATAGRASPSAGEPDKDGPGGRVGGDVLGRLLPSPKFPVLMLGIWLCAWVSAVGVLFGSCLRVEGCVFGEV
jgi:hypothetical protein